MPKRLHKSLKSQSKSRSVLAPKRDIFAASALQRREPIRPKRESPAESGSREGRGTSINHRSNGPRPSALFMASGTMSTNGTEPAERAEKQPLNSNIVVNELAPVLIFGICRE
jgi:hypothetical protein